MNNAGPVTNTTTCTRTVNSYTWANQSVVEPNVRTTVEFPQNNNRNKILDDLKKIKTYSS